MKHRMRSVCKCGHGMQEHVKPGLNRFIHPGSGPCIRCHCEKFEGVKPSGKGTGGISRYSLGTPPPGYSPSPEPEPLRW